MGRRLRQIRTPVPLLGAFAVLRVVAAARAPTLTPDSPTYSALSFLGHQPRLWTVPLFYNLLPTNDLREAGQITIGVMAWSLLAVAVRRSIRNPSIAHAGMAFVLLLGLVPQTTVWDGAMLSESLSISLLVVLVAGLLELSRGWSPRLLASVLGVAMLWVFARQDNAIVFAALVPVTAGFALWRLPRRPGRWMAVGLMAIAMWGGYCTALAKQQTPIWTYNAAELSIDRILPDPVATRYFAARGMPVAVVRASLAAPEEATIRLQHTRRFMRWAVRRFQGAYGMWLLRTFPASVLDPLRTMPTKITSSPVGYGRPHNVLPAAAVEWLWGGQGLRLWLLGALALGGIAVILRRPVAALGVIGVLIACAVALAVDAYNFATMEYPRLFMPAGLALRLGLVMTVVLAADALLGDLHDREEVHGRRGSPERAAVEQAYAAVAEGPEF